MKKTENVLQQLKEYIINGFKPGDRINTESELSEMFGVGRSTIRENLSILAAMGLINKSTIGSFVSDNINGCLTEPFKMILGMHKSNISYIVELRNILELNSFAMAIERVADDDIEKLEYIVWKMDSPKYVPEEFMHYDYEFHNLISEISGNAILVELISAARMIILEHAETLMHINEDPETRKRTNYHHREMVKALKNRDLDYGIKILREHLNSISEAFYGNEEYGSKAIDTKILVITQNTNGDTNTEELGVPQICGE